MTTREENEAESERLRNELYRVLRTSLIAWMRCQQHSCLAAHTEQPCPVAVATLTALSQLVVSHAIGVMNFDEKGMCSYIGEIFRMVEASVVARREAAGIALPKGPNDIN